MTKRVEPLKTINVRPAVGPVVALIAAGDFALTRALQKGCCGMLQEELYSPEILNLLHNKTISCVNLESAVSSNASPVLKEGPNLMSSPETIKALVAGNFDVIGLANNHMLDHGEAALKKTVVACRRAGMKTVGAGLNLSEAFQPAYSLCDGIRIGFAAFADEGIASASDSSAGIARLDLAPALATIRKMRQVCRFVVILVHAGNEYTVAPSPRLQTFCRCLAESGADLILGHHPHVVQGVEVHAGVPIAYSLGNFLFTYCGPRWRSWYEGVVAKVLLQESGVSAIQLFACKQVIRNGRPRVESILSEERERFSAPLERLSRIASDPLLVRQFWLCYCRKVGARYLSAFKMYSSAVSPAYWMLTKLAIKRGNVGYLFSALADLLHRSLRHKAARERDILFLREVLTHPARREVLETVIEMEHTRVGPPSEIWEEYQQIVKERDIAIH